MYFICFSIKFQFSVKEHNFQLDKKKSRNTESEKTSLYNVVQNNKDDNDVIYLFEEEEEKKAKFRNYKLDLLYNALIWFCESVIFIIIIIIMTKRTYLVGGL